MNKKIIEKLSVITEEEKAILGGEENIDRKIYTEESELVMSASKLLERGKLIQIRPHTRFIHFPEHRHNYVEVIYMCQGSTTHMINGNKVVLETGDLLFLNQNASQEIEAAREEDIAVNFIVLPEFFNRAFDMMKEEENLLRDFLVDSLGKGSRSAPYLYFHVSEVLPVQNLIENMVWTLLYNEPNKRSINQTTMGLLFLQLLNHMDKMETGEDPYEKEMTISILNYIENNYRDGSLGELAKIMQRDIYWLSKEVKRRTGKSFNEMMQTKKISQAAYLLLHSKLPVINIMEAIGYDNSSYFYRKFKERYGMTPKDYRRIPSKAFGIYEE